MLIVSFPPTPDASPPRSLSSRYPTSTPSSRSKPAKRPFNTSTTSTVSVLSALPPPPTRLLPDLHPSLSRLLLPPLSPPSPSSKLHPTPISLHRPFRSQSPRLRSPKSQQDSETPITKDIGRKRANWELSNSRSTGAGTEAGGLLSVSAHSFLLSLRFSSRCSSDLFLRLLFSTSQRRISSRSLASSLTGRSFFHWET